jgi:hypothetical protein
MSVIDILRESDLGTLYELPRSVSADFIWSSKNLDQTLGIPFKYLKENNAISWNFYIKKHIYILEFLDSKIMVLLPTEISFRNLSSKTLLNKFKTYQQNDIFDQFKTLINYEQLINYQLSIDDIKKDTKRKQKTSLNEENIYSKLKSDAHLELQEILSDNMIKTTECAKADWCYYKEDLTNVLPVKTKTTTKINNIYKFIKVNKYEEMLLVCRPMPMHEFGTFVIPGKLVKNKQLNITLKKDTKYWPYFIKDNYLKQFMSNLYEALSDNKVIFKWPSGLEIDISSIKLQEFKIISIPIINSNKKEFDNQNWMRQKFPLLNYENTKTDVIINGLRIQYKIANKNLQLSLQKSAGRFNKKLTHQPYEADDFDVLFIFPNDNRKYMFIIPMYILVKQGLIDTNTQKGKTSMHCVLQDKESDSNYKWTQDYCFDTEQDNIQEIVIEFLEDI